ncbi:hypothetical protein KZ483_25435 [Paenibacillus sp. sptzw28]|uniref:O-antigen ligase family protein n=1 Tax=Paenibacillus sp. sptzw28 TaxID=715179 RepID=UPI001C6ECC97|nr:hypothetical protein [Paenibacillus sp. sptzw28]QYR21033.1 hypothetical protein KZ483_25435 [Paenibacillus sp. sptzw28]
MNTISGEINQRIEHPRPIIKLLSLLFLILLLALMVNGSIPQLQMFLFSGNVPVPMTLVRFTAAVMCLGIITLTLRRRVEVDSMLMFTWFLFTSYLVIEIGLLATPTNSHLSIITSILSVYFFVFTIPLVLYLHGNLKEKQIIRILLSIFVLLAILGTIQFLLKEPLLPVSSNDLSFTVYSWNFHENVRAFSLFESGYSFGHYIAIAGAVFLLLPMNRSIKLLLMALVLFAGYSTLTRNAYLEIGAVLIAAFILSKKINNRAAPYILSFFNALAGYTVMKLAPVISSKFGGNDIVSIETHTSRVNEWSYIMEMWLSNDVYTALFGTGLAQGFGFQYVDNMYLAVGAQFGILGLISFGLLFLSMTGYVFREARARMTPLSIAIAAFWTSFPIVSFFNISLPPYLFVFIILMLARKERAGA